MTAKRQEKKATAADVVAQAKKKQIEHPAAAFNHCCFNHSFLFALDYGPSVSMSACACE